MADERMKTLKQRFSKQDTKPKPQRVRERHTLYLNKEIVAQIDQAYKRVAHDLFPQDINKSDYLEACFRFALDHQEEIKASLAESPHP